jgi:hypothetical protein
MVHPPAQFGDRHGDQGDGERVVRTYFTSGRGDEAARRRLPMVEVDANLQLVGPHGPVTLRQTFEGRRQLVAWYFMWHTGRPAAEQCEGDCRGARLEQMECCRHFRLLRSWLAQRVRAGARPAPPHAWDRSRTASPAFAHDPSATSPFRIAARIAPASSRCAVSGPGLAHRRRRRAWRRRPSISPIPAMPVARTVARATPTIPSPRPRPTATSVSARIKRATGRPSRAAPTSARISWVSRMIRPRRSYAIRSEEILPRRETAKTP